MAKAELELKKQPSFLTGYLKGLASRLGGDDEPILLSAAAYIEKANSLTDAQKAKASHTQETSANTHVRTND